ncbi:MAG: alpha/beta fold hydrolase [Solirubrobacteraceae bacterium]
MVELAGRTPGAGPRLVCVRPQSATVSTPRCGRLVRRKSDSLGRTTTSSLHCSPRSSGVRFDFVSSDLAVATRQVLAQLDRRPAWLVGYSFGGGVASLVNDPRVLDWCLVAPALALSRPLARSSGSTIAPNTFLPLSATLFSRHQRCETHQRAGRPPRTT